jgi:hypothetical protein
VSLLSVTPLSKLSSFESFVDRLNVRHQHVPLLLRHVQPPEPGKHLAVLLVKLADAHRRRAAKRPNRHPSILAELFYDHVARLVP